MSQEAWLNAKGIRSIRLGGPEKTSNMWSNLTVWDNCQNIPLFADILDVFSFLRNRIELISFALNQASRDTSLDYRQGYFEDISFSHILTLQPFCGDLNLTILSVKLVFQWSAILYLMGCIYYYHKFMKAEWQIDLFCHSTFIN